MTDTEGVDSPHPSAYSACRPPSGKDGKEKTVMTLEEIKAVLFEFLDDLPKAEETSRDNVIPFPVGTTSKEKGKVGRSPSACQRVQ
jgi:hypothetical protein